MNKYFTIEKENDIEEKNSNTIEDICAKKYYSIHIEGLPYGSLIRETDNYYEALDIYRNIKKLFYLFSCKVVLQKHIVNNDDTEEVTNIFVKQIGEEFDIKGHLKNIMNSLDQLDKMKRMYISTNSECDKYLSAFNHSLENINAERLNEDQMRNIFRNLEEKGALRRISKSQIDHLSSLQNNLSSIRSNANKALETFNKIEYNRKSQKAVENRILKDKEYLSKIGLI